MKTIYLLGNITPKSYMNDSEIKGELTIKNQFAQKSIFAFGNNPLDIRSNKIKYENKWALDQCVDELTHGYEKQLLSEPADYLLFDALGSIIPVRGVTCRNVATKVTWNNHMAKICNGLAEDGIMKVNENKEVFKRQDIIKITTDFCKSLLKVYSQDRIIIHMASYPVYYLQDGVKQKYSDSEIESRRNNNEDLKLIYDVIKEWIPNAYYIRMPSAACSAAKDKQLTFSDEYMKYLVFSILMYLNPALAQKKLAEEYDKA